MRVPPPEVLATWPAPNYVDPETRGPTLLIAELTIMPLAFVVLALRLYCRIIKVRNSGWDDWLMVIAMFFSINVTICVILADQLYGWSVHVWDLTPEQAVAGRQVSLAGQTLFVFASNIAKLSILMSYRRIAPQGSWFWKLNCASFWVVGAITPIFFIVLWTQCIPMSDYWTFSPERNCIAEGPPLMAAVITCVLTDLLLYLLPMPTFLKLKLPLRERLVLILAFSLGFVVVVAGIQRTYWMHYIVEETFDVTWSSEPLWIWTALETNLGVICGSIPTLRPLFRTNAEAFRVSRKGSSTPGTWTSHTRGPSGASGMRTSVWAEQGKNSIASSQADAIHLKRDVYGAYDNLNSPESRVELRTWLEETTSLEPIHSPAHNRL